MAMKRTKTPWMPADAYGRSFKPALGVNLLVRDVARSVAFQTDVIAAEAVYCDEDFAAMRFAGSQWMVHADHAYLDHPMTGIVGGTQTRGAGVEIRIYGRNPDAAEAAARAADHIVLAGAIDKPHGLREAFIIDPDGYVWVPGVAIGP